MSGPSSIEWTERTWNPIVGCSIVSPGCTNCYAMRMAARIERMGGAPHYAGLTTETKAGPVWTGKLALAPESVLLAPLRRRKPTTWFVNSMGDLFHESVPDEWIDRVFAVMARAPQHTFQVLTKRSARMREYLTAPDLFARLADAILHRYDPSEPLAPHRAGVAWTDGPRPAWGVLRAVHGIRASVDPWPLPNIWLGVSAEDQRRADERVPDLLATPAAVRFVSAEPLLGPINFRELRQYNPGAYPWINALSGAVTSGGLPRSPDECGINIRTEWSLPRLDLIIVGGESGKGARVWSGFDDAARAIRDQCSTAKVAFFMKQMAGPRKSAMPPIPADLMVRQLPAPTHEAAS